MELKININREGIKNEEIKLLREFLSDLTTREIIALCEGNTFKYKEYVKGSDNPLIVEFKIN